MHICLCKWVLKICTHLHHCLGESLLSTGIHWLLALADGATNSQLSAAIYGKWSLPILSLPIFSWCWQMITVIVQSVCYLTFVQNGGYQFTVIFSNALANGCYQLAVIRSNAVN